MSLASFWSNLTAGFKSSRNPVDENAGSKDPNWHSHTICVAGLSNAGKTTLLKAHLEYDRPVPGWNASDNMPWLFGPGRYTILEVHEGIKTRGPLPPATVADYVLQTVLLKPKKGGNIRLRIADVAGGDFEALSAKEPEWKLDPQTQQPLLDDAGNKIPSTLTLLLDAQVLFLMIAPADVADGARIQKIIDSLGELQAARQAKGFTHLPSIHVIFTKADEYGLPWTVYEGRHDLDTVRNDPIFGRIVPPCGDILAALENMAEGAPIRLYFSAAQSFDPSFGRNHPANQVALGDHPAKYQEGWNRRGNLQIFRDAFEVLHENRGRGISGLWKTVWITLALFSAIILVDLLRASAAYTAEWKEWKDITEGEVTDMASLTNFIKGEILQDSLVPRMERGWDADPSILLGYIYRPLTLAGRLERDLNHARAAVPDSNAKRNLRAWFDQ